MWRVLLGGLALVFSQNVAAADFSSALEGEPTTSEACMAAALYWEARAENRENIALRGWTIIWRVRRDDYPNSVCDVVFSDNQFSAFNNGYKIPQNKESYERVARIALDVLRKAMPDSFGGTECVDYDIYTGNCIVTLADTLPPEPPLMTHFAEASCEFYDKPGYNYIKTDGVCVPYWAQDMKQVAAVKRSYGGQTIFWQEM